MDICNTKRAANAYETPVYSHLEEPHVVAKGNTQEEAHSTSREE